MGYAALNPYYKISDRTDYISPPAQEAFDCTDPQPTAFDLI